MDDPKTPQQLFAPRVRIAPSPTGWFHFGTARTALFNFLFARKTGGKFILRIEDTDQIRSKKLYEDNIKEGLKWLNLEWDEGPDKAGDFGPYRQSERIDIYKKYLQQLLDEGKAYYCFCSPEEIEAQKQDMVSRGLPPKYSGKCRDLSPETVKQYFKEGKNPVIRIKMPNKIIKFNDIIRGEVEFNLDLLEDIIIAKSLTEPLYNFSVVIDDYLMQITHVIRGEDHVSNTPKQIVIQEALGLPRPIYAHLPMILGPDRSKFSKRHGATALSEYQKLGYLPEAIVNFLALLGWHPVGDNEIMNLEQLINNFELERVQKGGAIFNIQKLNWFNNQYLKLLPREKVFAYFEEYMKKYPRKFDLPNTSHEYLNKVLESEILRINNFSEIFTNSDFFFTKNLHYQKDLLIWKGESEQTTKQALIDASKIMESIPEIDFNSINLQAKFYSFIDNNAFYQQNRGRILWPLRAALSGKSASPGPFEIAEILGKKETIKRIKQAIELI
ncbi:MAG: glutamate--tRNA ligase [Parcubacteria group bacterium]|nr:glutamate--tRNA ligase [Parcubacteria group bacterium]